MPTLGSIVQKGKLAACAFPFSQIALNMVDLPTLGSPTIPFLSASVATVERNPLALSKARRTHLHVFGR